MTAQRRFRHWVQRQLQSSQADSVCICTCTSPASPSCPPRQQSEGFDALSSPLGATCTLQTRFPATTEVTGDKTAASCNQTPRNSLYRGRGGLNPTSPLLSFLLALGDPCTKLRAQCVQCQITFRRLFWFSWLVQMKSPLPQDV